MISHEQIRRYADLPVVLESEIGRSMLSVREVLSLSPGSVIQLPAAGGTQVQLLAGGAPFAMGELIRSGGTEAIRVLSFGIGKSR
ncbi:MAG TPA: FliM/FliN family flagellar motor C-terminal domain-containing protein [Bryobacteraceae bacterium]|jgi:flagellar motor switch protein FliN|nr:FliM/FliN family flagellar motor C-terminal domain-containing protein [Bryobacteraceae bacterium]